MKNLFISCLILITILEIYVTCGVAAVNNDTGIKISNEMARISEKQIQMSYKIVTPKIIHYDFVLALDSSGSFGDKSTQYQSVVRDVPKFLSKLQNYYPGAYFNMSIISWDNNIDFAYDKNFEYVDINKIMPLSSYRLTPLRNITKNFGKFYTLYKAKETESTDFSVPIKASLDIFNNPENAPKDPIHTLRFIMLVTGNGEYTPSNPDLIQEVRNKKIGIYTVGLDIREDVEKEIYQYLKEISRNKINETPSESGSFNLLLVNTTPFETELNNTLEAALREHFNRIMNTSVADDIEISDQLFGYYNLQPMSFSVNSMQSKSIKRDQTMQSQIRSNPLLDGTSKVNIKLNELLPNSTTTVAYTVENTFDPMALPVTVAEHKGPLTICTPTEYAQPTLIYTWHSTNLPKSLLLDIVTHRDGRLNVMSAKDVNLNETSRRENLGFIKVINLLVSFLSGKG